MLKSAIILICSLVLDALLPKSGNIRPLRWLEKYARTVVRLFRPALSTNAPFRHYTRGGLALLMMLFPLLVFAVLPLFLPDQSGVLDLVLLVFVIDNVAQRRRFKTLQVAMARQDFETARTLAGEWLARDTRSLSTTDLARYALEAYAVNVFSRGLCVIFWFVVLGGVGAWWYLLIQLFERECARHGKSLVYFRHFATQWRTICEWVPVRLFAITVMVGPHPKRTWQCWRTQAWSWQAPPEQVLLAAIGGRLGLMLGGSMMEFGVNIIRPYVGIGDPVSTRDLARVDGLMNQCLWRWVLTLAFLVWVIYQPLNLD